MALISAKCPNYDNLVLVANTNLGVFFLPTEAVKSPNNSTLLPAGLRDQLPPFASHEAAVIQCIINSCESCGYERVKPPLVEFEDSLFFGPGATMMQSTFRLMDPISQRMLGFRSDLTVQVARIAASRLGHIPRPLRLCYAGEVLRVMPDDLNPERELVQVGAELIGEDNPSADIEVIFLAYDSLCKLGVQRISIDVTAPKLVLSLIEALGLDLSCSTQLRGALDRKDSSAVKEIAGVNSELFLGLISSAGEWENSLRKIKALNLPMEVSSIVERLAAVTTFIAAEDKNIEVTIDPVESRGFEYYTGLGFSFFSRGIRGELGRGGRYSLDGSSATSSCGFTLYMETLLRALPDPIRKHRIMVPYLVDRRILIELRAKGWSTVGLFKEVRDLETEARRLNCSHILVDGNPTEI